MHGMGQQGPNNKGKTTQKIKIHVKLLNLLAQNFTSLSVAVREPQGFVLGIAVFAIPWGRFIVNHLLQSHVQMR